VNKSIKFIQAQKGIFMKSILFAFAILVSQGAFSQGTMKSYLDFRAPVIYSTDNLPYDVPGGAIVFDTKTGVFKGLVPAGSENNWVTLSAPSGSNAVVSSGATERIERATIHVTGATSCSVVSSSGSTSWLSSCSASGSLATLPIPSGVFSATPTCVATCNPQSNGKCVVRLTGGSATSLVIGAIDASNGNYINEEFNVICMGPK
jgi:hypothetical protein